MKGRRVWAATALDPFDLPLSRKSAHKPETACTSLRLQTCNQPSQAGLVAEAGSLVCPGGVVWHFRPCKFVENVDRRDGYTPPGHLPCATQRPHSPQGGYTSTVSATACVRVFQHRAHGLLADVLGIA